MNDHNESIMANLPTMEEAYKDYSRDDLLNEMRGHMEDKVHWHTALATTEKRAGEADESIDFWKGIYLELYNECLIRPHSTDIDIIEKFQMAAEQVRAALASTGEEEGDG